jgi:hypothetical protein
MVSMCGPETDTGAVIEPQPTPFWVVFGEPSAPPDARYAPPACGLPTNLLFAAGLLSVGIHNAHTGRPG